MDTRKTWFSKKVGKTRGEFTLEDRTQVFREEGIRIGIKISERVEEKMIREIREQLFLFEKSEGYSARRHVYLHDLITGIAPFIGIDDKDIKEYRVAFEKALMKHESEIPFSNNFQTGYEEEN